MLKQKTIFFRYLVGYFQPGLGFEHISLGALTLFEQALIDFLLLGQSLALHTRQRQLVVREQGIQVSTDNAHRHLVGVGLELLGALLGLHLALAVVLTQEVTGSVQSAIPVKVINELSFK